MHRYRSHADPPPTLARRLARLNGDLVLLGDRLKAAIGTAVGEAVAAAVADVVRHLLGGERPAIAPTVRHGWEEDEDPWLDEEPVDWSVPLHESVPAPSDGQESWADVLASTLQAGLWWLGRPTTPRPLFVALLTLCAGALAALARPALAAGASAFATLTGLLATVDSAAALTGSRR